MTDPTAPAGPSGAFPIGGGVFLAVVGPSGAGKDSVIAFAHARLKAEPRVQFARRVITRPSDPAAEDHETLDEAAFAAERGRGAFALTWSSHGLDYGIPVSVDEVVGSGAVAVANISRGMVPTLRSRYRNVAVAHVTASREALAHRLSSRGRESQSEVLQRLARNQDYAKGIEGVFTIDNSGPLDVAGSLFLAFIRDRIEVGLRFRG